MVGTVINEELCKRMDFDHIAKWYEHESKSAQENPAEFRDTNQSPNPGKKTRDSNN